MLGNHATLAHVGRLHIRVVAVRAATSILRQRCFLILLNTLKLRVVPKVSYRYLLRSLSSLVLTLIAEDTKVELVLKRVRGEWPLVARSHLILSIRDITWKVWLMTLSSRQVSLPVVVSHLLSLIQILKHKCVII